MGMPGRPWSDDDEHFVGVQRAHMRIETIARKLGRTEHAVYQRRYWPTRDEFLTSGMAAQEAGYSAQWLTKLAREHKIRAHRVPGGRWWLFKREYLPKRVSADSAASKTQG